MHRDTDAQDEQVGRHTVMVLKQPNSKFQIQPYQTKFTLPHSPAPAYPGDGHQTGVGPFYGWLSQLREQLHSRTKTQVPGPSLTTHKENSACWHAHLSSAETSQSPVDNPNKERGERWFLMSMLLQRGNAMQPALTADGSTDKPRKDKIYDSGNEKQFKK